jgi:hypothetical protein
VADFVDAAWVDDLPPGMGACVPVPGQDVALFNVDGKFMVAVVAPPPAAC